MADFLIKKEQIAGRYAMFRQGAGLLLYVSLGLFFLILLGYLTLFFIGRSQARAKTTLLREIQIKQDELRPELIGQIFTLESRLKNMQNILDGHVFTINLLKFLEENTLATVRYLNFDFKTDTRRLEMAGEAGSYASLAEQITLLERHPQVEKVEFGGLTLGAGNLVNFRLTIVFRPPLLKNPALIEEGEEFR